MGTTNHLTIKDTAFIKRIPEARWGQHTDELLTKGYTLVPALLTSDDCDGLVGLYSDPDKFRKSVNMARHRFGEGEYKYFRYPLPEIIQTLRESLYPNLSRVANTWNQALSINYRYPSSHGDLLGQCRLAGQLLPTPLILKYGAGGYNTLHQDLYGEVFFPMQAVVLLSDPDSDFTGGEFVLVEQVPRAQSRVIVLKLRKGDALIFTTRFRPERGSKGYYRVQVKHGVSDISEGCRYSMGIIFHDALS